MKIEDVLHLYLGQRVAEDYTGKSPNGILFGVQGDTVKVKTNTVWTFSKDEVKLILRRLSDMSEDEWIELGKIHVKNGGKIKITMGHGPAHPGIKYYPDVFLYLLSKGFWLWEDNAFDDGLIIDTKTVTV